MVGQLGLGGPRLPHLHIWYLADHWPGFSSMWSFQQASLAGRTRAKTAKPVEPKLRTLTVSAATFYLAEHITRWGQIQRIRNKILTSWCKLLREFVAIFSLPQKPPFGVRMSGSGYLPKVKRGEKSRRLFTPGRGGVGAGWACRERRGPCVLWSFCLHIKRVRGYGCVFNMSKSWFYLNYEVITFAAFDL